MVSMLSGLPDVILLDMDNTIYEYAPCHDSALTKVASYLKDSLHMDPSVFVERYNIARQVIKSRLMNTASSHSRLLYFQHLLEISGYGMKIHLAVKLNEMYWETFISNIILHEYVQEFLVHARNKGIPIVLVTDLTADVQFRKIIHLNMENLFDVYVTSEEAGTDKPSGAIFELALKKLNRPAHRIWMIGDNLSKDIAGGKCIGAVTFLKTYSRTEALNPFRDVRPDFVFTSFQELIDIIKRMERNH